MSQQPPVDASVESPSNTVNVFSVDVEDYFQVTGFERDICRDQWGQFESRVEANTRRLMEMLDERDVKATFFVVGWVASRFPQLVKDIYSAGHEVGCHSYWHRLVYDLNPPEFREDLCQSRDVLEDIIGAPVTSYRAPSFSITARSLWALEILAEEGFKTDASVYPVRYSRYGIPNAPRHPYVWNGKSGKLWMFPSTVYRFGNFNVPISGGGYFRLFPYSFTASLLRRINQRQSMPFMFYIHPWEIDPEQPRLDAGTRLSRYRHYQNLSLTKNRLSLLLDQFQFGRLCDVLSDGHFHDAMTHATPVELAGVSHLGTDSLRRRAPIKTTAT